MFNGVENGMTIMGGPRFVSEPPEKATGNGGSTISGNSSSPDRAPGVPSDSQSREQLGREEKGGGHPGIRDAGKSNAANSPDHGV